VDLTLITTLVSDIYSSQWNTEAHITSCCLVFFAYAVVTLDNVVLFVDSNQLDDTVIEHLGDQVLVKPYLSFFQYLKTLPGLLKSTNNAVSLNCILLLKTLLTNHLQQVLLGDKTSLAVAEAIGPVGWSPLC
jgi:Xaa-Pro aminopeptidase